MATAGVLEKSEKKAFLDDSTPLTASFVTHRVVPKQNYVEYVMRVQRGPAHEEFWEVRHRYSDFSKLAALLQPCQAAGELPPKKVFGSTDQQFVLERQVGLEKFLSAILKDPLVRNHMEVKKFLDPINYPCNFFDRGLQSVSMFFRSEPSWKIEENLRDLGWRIRKQHFLIKNKADPKLPSHLLTRCEPGPDFSLGLKEIKACLRVLTDIQHPFILSPTLADFDDMALMVVRPFINSGSLKDAIYEKHPKGPALLKYGQPPRVKKLTLDNVKQYGRQILEALNFLSEKGFVLGQVHAGNVLICGGNCKLVEIENTLVGVPSPYRHYLVEIKKIRSHIGETVYSFGQMLYEMWTGAPLGMASLDACPTSFPLDIGKIIDSILTPKAFKEGLPSLSDLLSNPFFTAGYGAPGSEKPHLRVPSKMKEALRVHLEKAENRLLAEQKKVAQYQRLSKVQENLMSEDERLKRRKLRKKQMSLQEEEAPQAYPTTTSLPRQNTIGTSGISHSKKQPSSTPSSTTPTTNGSSPTGAARTPKNTNSSNSKNTPSKTKPPASKGPPPQSSAVPEARTVPRADRERGALLGSIEGFTKGKLKKAKTNDRSAPKI